MTKEDIEKIAEKILGEFKSKQNADSDAWEFGKEMFVLGAQHVLSQQVIDKGKFKRFFENGESLDGLTDYQVDIFVEMLQVIKPYLAQGHQQAKGKEELKKEYINRYYRSSPHVCEDIWSFFEPHLNAQKEEWVNTLDRLPEDNQRVLFTSSHPDVRLGTFLLKDEWGRENMFCDGAFHFSANIKFWIPISAPPIKL